MDFSRRNQKKWLCKQQRAMRRVKATILATWTLFVGCLITDAAEPISLATLNCYWFFGTENYANADKPISTNEYSLKAGHLIGLLPQDAPLLVGLQEIGNDQDVQALACSATRRYSRDFKPLFVQGRDTATKQDVGALFDTSRGWGVYGKASRVSELEKELTKHLVVRLTNGAAHIDVSVVHLRRPIGADGVAKQNEQNQALLRWSMRHLAKDPKANLVILGDFNEGGAVGSPSQSLAVLFQAQPALIDVFDHFKGRPVTHTAGKAFDRILISDGLFRGASGLKFSAVGIMRHGYGKGEDRRLYTDHYPVVATFSFSER
jgi:hypothetical protein